MIARAAEAAGAHPDQVLADAHSDALRTEVSEGWKRAHDEAGVFGVPSFVVGKELFWGQDRMHHIRAAIEGALAHGH